jgi:hypothetical protein
VDAELLAWVLLVVGLVLMALLGLVLMGHVRRLGRERAAATSDVRSRWAVVQALLATIRSARHRRPTPRHRRVS